VAAPNQETGKSRFIPCLLDQATISMVLSVQQIKFEMFSYIKEFDCRFQAWYVGIARDPKSHMQLAHGVDLEKDIWLYKQALSFAACRTVQRYFTGNLKTDGILVSSGNEDTDCVYLYKKSERTRP
jgi:hypothetical protein